MKQGTYARRIQLVADRLRLLAQAATAFESKFTSWVVEVNSTAAHMEEAVSCDPAETEDGSGVEVYEWWEPTPASLKASELHAPQAQAALAAFGLVYRSTLSAMEGLSIALGPRFVDAPREQIDAIKLLRRCVEELPWPKSAAAYGDVDCTRLMDEADEFRREYTRAGLATQLRTLRVQVELLASWRGRDELEHADENGEPEPSSASRTSVADAYDATTSDMTQPRIAHAPQVNQVGSATAVAGDAVDRRYIFLRQGSGWSLEYEGEVGVFKSTVGLSYIHTLIQKRGQRVSVSDLRGGNHTVARPDEAMSPEDRRLTRDRALELINEAKTAKQAGRSDDAERANSLANEIMMHYRRSTGRGGRARKLGDQCERDRKSVGKAIRKALEQVGQEMPSLANHLRESIDDPWGFSPMYRAREGVNWLL